MRIIQVLPTLAYGDAVGNDCLAIKDFLLDHHYETSIYAGIVDDRIDDPNVKTIKEWPGCNNDDLIIYHFSTGSGMNVWIKNQTGRKIMIYHNITPPDFFLKYNAEAYNNCVTGYEQIRDLKDTFEYVIAVSEFNKKCLIEMGYSCKIDVLPILIPFEDYDNEPDKILQRYMDDDYTNILFVGRIAPNKKQEDIIRAFSIYKKVYNPKSRLILVGSYKGMEQYYQQLVEYAQRLDVSDVVFSGHIRFSEILAYYKTADLFLCMSEHEGFCVPLIEAMYFDLPIIAYGSSAIPDTLGGSGVLIKDRNFDEIAGMMNYVLTHDTLKQRIIENERERLVDFNRKKIQDQLLEFLNPFISQVGV